MSSYNTLTEVLTCRVEARADTRGYTYLRDGETDEVGLTYRELDLQARAIAGHLVTLAAPGERALLLYPPGLAVIPATFGCLYAGLVAVPAPLPGPGHPLDGLRGLVTDARPAVVLTTVAMQALLGQVSAGIPDLAGLPIVATDGLGPDPDRSRSVLPVIDGDHPALLAYTSGTTRDPRGVMLTHHQLLGRLAEMHNASQLVPDSRLLYWGPMQYGIGLIGGAFIPLVGDLPAVLMSPAHFIERPIRWLRAISRFQCTIAYGASFALQICIDRTTPAERAGLDLSCLRWLVVSAEPVRAEILSRFSEAYAPHGLRSDIFVSIYGMTESAGSLTWNDPRQGPALQAFDRQALARGQVVPVPDGTPGAQVLVGCGHPYPEDTMLVVDPATRTVCAAGRLGEIWSAGPFMPTGYWGRPELSAETFGGTVAGSSARPFLRTGDLGFFYADQIYIAGRLKDVLIVRGNNLYASDIEAAAEGAHPALQTGAGAAIEVSGPNGETQIVLLLEVKPGSGTVSADEVGAAVRQVMAAAFDLPVQAILLMRPGSLPRTTSGKVARQRCRQAYLARQEPQTE